MTELKSAAEARAISRSVNNELETPAFEQCKKNIITAANKGFSNTECPRLCNSYVKVLEKVGYRVQFNTASTPDSGNYNSVVTWDDFHSYDKNNDCGRK
jgi:hypothetical protein